MSLGTYTEAVKLVGEVATKGSREGVSVKLSDDGNFLFIGASDSDSNVGAVWFYQKVNGVWTQKQKITPTGDSVLYFGSSLAVNPPMNTLLVGAGTNYGICALVFTFDGVTWTQQGPPLFGYTTSNGGDKSSVALSADGNTAIVGSPGDTGGIGASWIFVRVASNWAQQGPKLAATDFGQVYQGYAVAISSDGNLAIVGGKSSNFIWIYKRVGTTWSQFGPRINGTVSVGEPYNFGRSLALSGNDQTLFIGGNTVRGPCNYYYCQQFNSTVWTFKRTGNTFVQIQSTPVGGLIRTQFQEFALATNKAGSIFAVGDTFDTNDCGTVYMYGLNGAVVNQIGTKITATDASTSVSTYQGYSLSLDSSGSQLLFGAPNDGYYGAAWVYANAAITSSPSFAPTAPTITPSKVPTVTPSVTPTKLPTINPTILPTDIPTALPSQTPTTVPTILPSTLPTMEPTLFPTFLPTGVPNLNPTVLPSRIPTNQPSTKPSLAPIALTGAAGASSLNALSIIIIAVIGGLALICTLLLIRYRLSRNYREANTGVGEVSEWIEDAKTNANHSSYIRSQHSSKQAKAEDHLLTDVYADNTRNDEML